MMPLRILLVEDDAVISALLAELLAECGHHVCGTATTEMQAVATAARHTPDLMIVDVHLQAGSGVSAMETILRHSAMRHIFMTGGSRQSVPAGAVVLHKPFGKAALTADLESEAWRFAASASKVMHGRR